MYIDHTHRENQKVVTKIIELLPGTLNFSNLTMKFREGGVLIMYMYAGGLGLIKSLKNMTSS